MLICAVVWNVIATPAFSLQPQTWCYPLAGCLAYRGWYRRSAAIDEAQRLHDKQKDVLVSSATAYSTLGWFDDPLLNTMLRYSDAYLEPILASLIFHELAHQQLFVAGATGFNEAFAETVAHEGVRRWLQLKGDFELSKRWEAWQQSNNIVNALLATAREQLLIAYADELDQEKTLRNKQQVFIDLRRAYLRKLDEVQASSELHRALLTWRWWFAQPLNNAHLALHSTYQQGVQAFQDLLMCNQQELSRFYQAADQLGEWPVEKRQAWLQGDDPTPDAVCVSQSAKRVVMNLGSL